MVTFSMSTAVSQFRFKQRPIVVVMGVSGCGKSTVAAALATRLNLPFLEGDEFHPQRNVEKMSQGLPLTDQDRWPWLTTLGASMGKLASEVGGVVSACSALKKSYRSHLSKAVGLPVFYVLLEAKRETLLQRMQARKDHYMPASLLDSQLAILEVPGPDEPALILNYEFDLDTLLDELEPSLIAMTDNNKKEAEDGGDASVDGI